MHGDDYEPSRPIELFGHHGGADDEDEDDAGLPLAFDDATDSSSGAFMLRGGAVRYHHGAAQEGHSGVGFQPGQPGDYCWAYSSSGSGSSSSSSSSVLSFEQGAGCRPPAYNAGEDDTALWMDAAAMDPPGDYSHRQFGFVHGRSNSSDVGLGRDSFQQPKVPPQKRASPGGEMQPAEKKPCGGATRRSSKAKAKAAAAAAAPTKDTQTVAAKVRRERISERLKVLQDLVPNGTKVDLVTMLEKAINYVKFLQLQVKVLATDEFWPAQGGKAPELSQVKEALDAILSSQRDINSKQ